METISMVEKDHQVLFPGGSLELLQVPFLTTMLCVRHPDVSLATTLVFLQGLASSGAVAMIMNLGVGPLAWILKHFETL